MPTIRIPGSKAIVEQWLPKLIAMAKGGGIEVHPGVTVFLPDDFTINPSVDESGRLVLSFPTSPTVKIDAGSMCMRFRATEPMGAVTVGEKVAQVDIPGIPFGQGKVLLEYAD